MLSGFENDLLAIIDNLQFKRKKSGFQKEISAELEEIKRTKKILIAGDKTKNIYLVSPNCYKRKLANEVTKSYKKAPSSYFNSINNEDQEISNKMCIYDKILTLCQNEEFLTVKDH